MPAYPLQQDPPLAPPHGRRGAALALSLGAVLAALAVVEAGNTTLFPVAALAAGLLLFAGLCVFHLETAFLLLLVVTPFSVEMAFPQAGGSLQIPTEPMLFLALAAWGLRFLSRGSTRIAEPALTGLLLLAILTCLFSLLDAQFKFSGMKATLNSLWYMLYGLFLLNNMDSVRRLKGLAAALIIPGLIVTAVSLVLVSLGRYNPAAGLWAARPYFTEHGSFAAYLSFVMALLLGLALEARGGARFALGAAALLVGIQIVLSLTRGAWLGTAVLLVFLALLYRRRLLHPAGLVFTAIVLVAAGYLLVSTGVIERLQIYTKTTSAPGYTSNLERVNRWAAGWSMVRSDPATGVGYGTYPDLYSSFRNFPAGTDQSSIRMGIHSEYFKVLVETGLVGAAVGILVLARVLWLAGQAIRGARTPFLRGLAVGLAGGLLTYMVHAWVNNFMMFDKVAIPVWTAVGGFGAIHHLNRTRPGPPVSIHD